MNRAIDSPNANGTEPNGTKRNGTARNGCRGRVRNTSTWRLHSTLQMVEAYINRTTPHTNVYIRFGNVRGRTPPRGGGWRWRRCHRQKPSRDDSHDEDVVVSIIGMRIAVQYALEKFVRCNLTLNSCRCYHSVSYVIYWAIPLYTHNRRSVLFDWVVDTFNGYTQAASCEYFSVQLYGSDKTLKMCEHVYTHTHTCSRIG